MTTDSAWKDSLLKTGLPLEYVTAKLLASNGFNVNGSFPYLRPNENSELREFSIDLLASKYFASQPLNITLTLLIECKFRQDGTQWIFSPYPNHLISAGVISSTKSFIPFKLPNANILFFETGIGYCVSGVEIGKSKGTRDGVSHGIYQLKFALPPLLEDVFKKAFHEIESIGISGYNQIEFICPILVTTAQLRIIKPDLSLTDFRSADNIDKVTDIKNALIFNEEPGPQLKDHSINSANSLLNTMSKKIHDLLNSIDKSYIKPIPKEPGLSLVGQIYQALRECTERVIVVNLEHFESLIKNIELSIGKECDAAECRNPFDSKTNYILLKKTK